MNYETMSDFETSCRVVAESLNLLKAWFPYKFDEEHKVFFMRSISGNAKRRVIVTFDMNNPSDAWPILTQLIKEGHFIAFNGDSVVCDMWHEYHDEGQELRALMIIFLKLKEQ
jgi:hypothetical protein